MLALVKGVQALGPASPMRNDKSLSACNPAFAARFLSRPESFFSNLHANNTITNNCPQLAGEGEVLLKSSLSQSETHAERKAEAAKRANEQLQQMRQARQQQLDAVLKRNQQIRANAWM